VRPERRPRLQVRLANGCGAFVSDVRERNREAQQRVRDAGISPVDEAVAAVPDADVPGVQVVVLD
jgi:hypothetical protein